MNNNHKTERKNTDQFREELIKIFKKKPQNDHELQCKRNHTIENSSGLTSLKINCEGCDKSSSFSDETCRKQVITKLVENPVDKVEFARRLTTEEYSKEDVETLKEIADLSTNIKGAPFGTFNTSCGECAEKIKELRETILESLKTDPINTYRKLQSPVGKERVHVKPQCRRCANLRIKTLDNIKRSLENTGIIRKTKDHLDLDNASLYRKVFTPRIRPFLSESRIILETPEDAKSACEEYRVEGAKVRIYRVNSWDEDFYQITPPEYELREKPRILEMLMQTREWLLKNAAEQIESTDTTENTKRKFRSLCKIRILETASENKVMLSEKEADRLVDILVRCTRGLDVIELLLKDPNVNDVYVNSPMESTPVYVKHKDFDDCRTNIYLSEERANNFVLKFVLKSGIGLTPSSPILDMDLEELKTRVSVIAPPLSPDGIAFSLRCKNEKPWTLPMLMEKNMISSLGAGLLTTIVNDQVALLVVGGRGTGKTSFLGSLMSSMNSKYRVLTLEDTLELPVPELNDAGFRIQRMLTKPITTSEGINITADDALRSSLRMGESSIVIGEVRGKEARVLYESIRVGATGNTVLGTIHGRNARDVFERVVYDLKIPATSFKATDVVVVTERLPVGRRVKEIAELNKDIDIEKLGSGAEASKLFETLMRYESETDQLKLPEKHSPEKSAVIRLIAERRGISPCRVWEDVETRARMHEQIIKWHRETGIHTILEIQAVIDANKKYTTLIDDQRRKDEGRYRNVDYKKAYADWLVWGQNYVESLKRI
ncbi:MAG: CpaF family protein [Candidatus Altiarchaeota archaeon]|nr:CpaF family protein [Candidatus Altiarchaeota archaeon]